jgi:hypothetical protein
MMIESCSLSDCLNVEARPHARFQGSRSAFYVVTCAALENVIGRDTMEGSQKDNSLQNAREREYSK